MNQAMQTMSLFNTGPNICFTNILQKEAYARSPQLVAWLQKVHSRIGGSQLVEDGVNRGRRSEQLASSTAMSPDRAYATLLTKNVLGGVHKYNEAFLCC